MPASPIYLDSEEEISELIERLRQTSSQDVSVVVPSRSRIGESRFNFKLLRDYARQFGKRISIISPEPAIQHLAQENGFDAFADLEGFGAPASEPAYAMAGAATGYESYAPPQAPSPVVEPVAPVAPDTRVPKMSMTPQRRLLANTGGSRGRMVLYAGAALIALVAFLAAAILIPTANITITAKAQALNDTANVDAAPGAAPVKVRQVTTTKSLSQQFTATGVKVTPAVNATGKATYTNKCGFSAALPSGTRLVTPAGIEFAQIPDTPQMPPNSSFPFDVAAVNAGPGGNVLAHQITQFKHPNLFPPCWTVDNPAATAGGADEVKQTYISQGDLDSAKAALQGTLRGTVIDDLTRQALNTEKLADTIDYVPTFTADHKASDVAPLFNGSVSMVGNGAVYNVDDVKAALKADLVKHVPAGFSLTDDAVQSDFHVSQSTADGHISFAGTAKGFIAPKLDFKKIQNRLLGSNTASARIYLQTLPIEKADVKEKPFTLPLMPFLSSHIHINYVVDKGITPPATPAQ